MVEKLYVTYNQVSYSQKRAAAEACMLYTVDFTACVRPETTEMGLCALRAMSALHMLDQLRSRSRQPTSPNKIGPLQHPTDITQVHKHCHAVLRSL